MKKGIFIIVTYNGSSYIERLLSSIEIYEPTADLVIIDNNSTDNTSGLIPKSPKIFFNRMNKNLGFGQANNIGLKFALENNYEYVFLINQDAFLIEPILQKCVSLAEQEEKIGVISPMQFAANGNKLEINFDKFLYQQGIYNKIISDLICNKIVNEFYPVDFIQAAAWFIPIRTLKKVGGFDPVFFHYGEDNNYLQRVRYFGLSAVVLTNLKISHDSNDFNSNYPKDYGNYHLNRLKSIFFIEHADITVEKNNKYIFLAIKNELKKLIYSLLTFRFKRIPGIINYIKFIIITWPFLDKIRDNNKISGPNYLT